MQSPITQNKSLLYFLPALLPLLVAPQQLDPLLPVLPEELLLEDVEIHDTPGDAQFVGEGLAHGL